MVNENINNRISEFQNKGIHTVNDLLDENGSRLGFIDFQNQYNIAINFVDFYSLTHSVPREWILNWQTKLVSCQQVGVEQLLGMDKVCRNTYQKLIKNKINCRNHRQKWEHAIGMNLTDQQWGIIYGKNFEATVESRMRAFQYKILMRTLTTKRYLKLCQITENDICFFCNQESETIEHLLWHCPIVNHFWRAVITKN